MKIIDKINAKIAEGKSFFSFEYFPPRTEEGVENLYEKQERMVAHGPIFCDITWGAGGTTADVTLDIATTMQNQICVDTMMHLTCTNMPVESLGSALTEVKKHGIQNILALRGDPPKGQDKFETVEGGLSCALDLVRYIRKSFGDYFGICVAGYPEAHPESIVDDPVQMEKNYAANIAYLKEKVDAGGELIITQLFYDINLFFKFVKDCRSAGITCPILPGIMPIMTYGGFKRMTGFCKTKVPQDLADQIEALKDNEEGLKAFGIDHGAEMCRQLLAAGTPGLHLYALNVEPTVFGILEKIGFIDTKKVPKSLPWRHIPMGTKRVVEGVRPVGWALHNRSYVKRSKAWESFPTQRWAKQSVANLAAPSAYLTSSATRKTKAGAAWGTELTSIEDIKAVFVKYFAGEITLLPWADGAFEAVGLKEKLTAAIGKGFLPINALAAVNGAASDDATAGWGGAGGLVYQKGYVEFFASPETFAALLPKLKESSSLAFIAKAAGGEVTSSAVLASDATSVVSWGVFPGKEIVQPYVLDRASFLARADEAFALWSVEWGNLYEADSPSLALLKGIQDSWVLVAVLDNDYVSGDVFKVLA